MNPVADASSLPVEIMVAGVYLAWVVVFLSLKKVGFLVFRRFAQQTKTHLDDIFVEAAQLPLLLLILASGGFAVARFLPSGYEAEFMKGYLGFFKAATIVAIVLFANRFLAELVREYTPRVEFLRDTSGIVHGLLRVFVLGLGALVLLDSFGVSITPVIASLGIGSLAVALALQPTLENFFAGIQIVLDKPFQVGNFVKLDSGEEGYVENIGWRTTWVRLLPNHMMIVPNNKIVGAKILNYDYPDKEVAVLVEVGVHYQCDLEKVEKVTVEVARETLRGVSGGVAGFEPFIRYHTLGDFSINFTVIMRARVFVDNYLIKHEFIKRLHKRYAQEGIVIPYPIRAVNYSQERTDSNLTKRD